MAKNVLHAIPLTTFNAAILSGTYQPINPNGFPQALTSMRLQNASNVNITISYDNTDDHDVILANSSLTLNSLAINSTTPDTVKLAKYTIIYVKGSMGTGTIYLAGYFLEQ